MNFIESIVESFISLVSFLRFWDKDKYCFNRWLWFYLLQGLVNYLRVIAYYARHILHSWTFYVCAWLCYHLLLLESETKSSKQKCFPIRLTYKILSEKFYIVLNLLEFVKIDKLTYIWIINVIIFFASSWFVLFYINRVVLIQYCHQKSTEII